MFPNSSYPSVCTDRLGAARSSRLAPGIRLLGILGHGGDCMADLTSRGVCVFLPPERPRRKATSETKHLQLLGYTPYEHEVISMKLRSLGLRFFFFFWRFVSYMILYMFQCHSPKSNNMERFANLRVILRRAHANLLRTIPILVHVLPMQAL